MHVRLRSFLVTAVLALTICLATGHAQAPVATAQAAAVDQKAIIRFVSAKTEADRLAALAEFPALAGDEGSSAISSYGEELAKRRNFALAERVYQAVIWLGEHLHSDRVLSGGLTGLGSVEGRKGNLVKSEALSLEALEIVERIGDPAFIQPVVANLAIVWRRLGDYDRAQAGFDRALALAEQLKRQDSVSKVYNNIGLLHFFQGNSRLAQEYFSRSLELKAGEDGEGSPEMATTLNNLGLLFDEQGDFPQALKYYEQALDVIARANGGGAATTPLSNVAHIKAAMGRTAEARAGFEQVLALAQESGESRVEATALYHLGTLARNDEQLSKAESLQRRSLAIREANGDAIGVTESLSELSNVLVRQDRAAEAEPLIANAVELAESAGLLHQLARAQLYQGQALDALGRPDEARAAYEACANTVEWLRERTTGGEQARQVFLSFRTGPYLSIADMEARAGKSLDALLAVERARARTLLDILAAGRQPTRALTEPERTRERQLANAVMTISLQLTSSRQTARPDVAAIRALETQLSEARLAREAFVSSLYTAKPELRLMRGDAPVITRQQLASVLAPGTGVVEWVVLAEGVWAFVVTDSTAGPVVTSTKLTTTAPELLKLSDRFARQIATRDLAFAETSRQLYDALLGQLDDQLTKVRHLVVVPDSSLWRVPFQALETPRGKFLVEERSLSYAPSLSALAALRDRHVQRTVDTPMLLALGDPQTGSLAPAQQRGESLGGLPEAAREVRALGRLYGRQASTIHVGADASEEVLRAAVSRASVLHIATHGILDDRAPMYSQLLLTPGSATDHRTDGRLEAWELLDLDIQAKLVVLSACQTASGLVGGGEGVIGLSWALLAAGASTAVLSQWEVDSSSTTDLMIAFHERLLSSTGPAATPAEALRAAAMKLMKDPRYRHPFYWAGFIAMGQ